MFFDVFMINGFCLEVEYDEEEIVEDDYDIVFVCLFLFMIIFDLDVDEDEYGEVFFEVEFEVMSLDNNSNKVFGGWIVVVFF